MKKLILILVLSIFLVPQVNAECINLVDYNSAYWFHRNNSPNYRLRLNNTLTDYHVPLTEGSTYTLYFNDGTRPFSDYLFNLDAITKFQLSNYHYLKKDYLVSNNSYTFTFKPSSGKNYFYFQFAYSEDIGSSPINELLTDIWLVEGDSICTTTIDPNPEPEPEIPPDNTLDSFYALYITKLSDFSNYALENKYILGTLVIIILFIVLELIFKLFNKGGYK